MRWLGRCGPLGVVLALGALTILPASAQSLTSLDQSKDKVQSCEETNTAIATTKPILPVCDRSSHIPAAAIVAAPPTTSPISGTQSLSSADGPPTIWPDEAVPLASVQQVDVDPAIIENSPVLQRWLEEVPNLAVDVNHDPAFRTRVRVGYAEFPSTDNTGGLYVGVQDVFIGRTPLTLSADYATNGRGDRQAFGVDAQYSVLPLGWYGNVAPVIGYRDIQTPAFESSGLNLGLRVVVIPSRTGTADLSITQSWVAPGTDREVGLTTFTAGYAIAEDLRIGTDIQIQNTRDRQESQVGLLLEWML
jgi:hypothetical protein